MLNIYILEEVKAIGGRGFESLATNQINLQEVIDRKEINDIIERSEIIRQGNISIDNTNQESKLKRCSCCENYSIPINTLNSECPICEWIDNEDQNNNLDSLDGPNSLTLRKAKQIWKNRGNTKNKETF